LTSATSVWASNVRVSRRETCWKEEDRRGVDRMEEDVGGGLAPLAIDIMQMCEVCRVRRVMSALSSCRRCRCLERFMCGSFVSPKQSTERGPRHLNLIRRVGLGEARRGEV
jgi:hypothetical protein